MTVMSENLEQVLSRLVAFAGSTDIVIAALREVEKVKGGDITLDHIIAKIAELKTEAEQREVARKAKKRELANA